MENGNLLSKTLSSSLFGWTYARKTGAITILLRPSNFGENGQSFKKHPVCRTMAELNIYS